MMGAAHGGHTKMLAQNDTKVHTRSGVIDPFRPRPSDINIDDIAHALANTCRWGAACSQFYSVAEHSIEVAHRVNDNLKLCALLHDAAEAYLGDIPTPRKAVTFHRYQDTCGVITEAYSVTEDRLMAAIFERFNVGYESIPDEVHEADLIVRREEERTLIRGVRTSPVLTPATARIMFLRRFNQYAIENRARLGVTV